MPDGPVYFSETILFWVRFYNEFESASEPLYEYILLKISSSQLQQVRSNNLRENAIYKTMHDSLERIQQYLIIERESEPEACGIPPAYWPSSGRLTVEKLSARYALVSLIQ